MSKSLDLIPSRAKTKTFILLQMLYIQEEEKPNLSNITTDKLFILLQNLNRQN
jgi:hypothetical protein